MEYGKVSTVVLQISTSSPLTFRVFTSKWNTPFCGFILIFKEAFNERTSIESRTASIGVSSYNGTFLKKEFQE